VKGYIRGNDRKDEGHDDEDRLTDLNWYTPLGYTDLDDDDDAVKKE
jgi:hypothetical protein